MLLEETHASINAVIILVPLFLQNTMNSISMIALLAATSVLSQTYNYTQYIYYSDDKCMSQPTTMIATQVGQCAIAGTPANQCNEFPGSKPYSSIRTVCSNSALDLKGINQVYVARYNWMTSETCQGNPTVVEATVADSQCYASSATDGIVNEWGSVNCNGGKPIYKTCSDAACNNCQESQYTGKCDIAGASASAQAMCIYPKTAGENYSGNGNDDTVSASSGASSHGSFYSAAIALMFTVALLESI
jgi:hypothetical protein